MKKSNQDRIDEIVTNLYREFELEFPVESPKAVIEKMGGTFSTAVKYKVGDEAIVKKHKGKPEILVCINEYLYGIDDHSRVETDWMIYRTLGQAILCMGYWVKPEKWETFPDGNYPYKNLRFRREVEQMEYFASAMILPKTLFLNELILNTNVGSYETTVDVWKMAEELRTTMPMVLERAKQLNVQL
jgi:hypothetical protein